MANTVLLFGHTDKQLQSMAIQQDFDGSMARKEIKRRKMVGYCDGTAIEYVDPKAKDRRAKLIAKNLNLIF